MIQPLMDATVDQWSHTGEPVNVDGRLNHTVSVSVANLRGRIVIEGAIAANPGEAEWFTMREIDFPRVANTNSGGETATVGVSFRFNLTWLRARLDRSDMVEPARYQIPAFGCVTSILTA